MTLPALHAPVFYTPKGTPYLKEPGVVVISVPHVDLEGVRGFLEGFKPELEFLDYLADEEIPDCEKLIKFAGQLCYFSFGKKRSKNKNAQRYLDHIKESGHGSVLEHANISMLLYGIDRSVTHELVRHRSGWGFSQVSQRYCNGDIIRFVERPEYQTVEPLHTRFESQIDRTLFEYEEAAYILAEAQGQNLAILHGDSKTELRKKVNQAARSELTNNVEAPIVVTCNLRAARHVVEMRAAGGADLPIRWLTSKMLKCMKQVAHMIFEDHNEIILPDGTSAIESKWRKV